MEISAVLFALVALAFAFLWFRDRLRSREAAHVLFDRWRERELARREAELARSLEIQSKAALERWKIDHEATIRGDAIKRSQAVVSGKTTEQLVPLLPDFPFDPRDARFLGSPVDFVVFDGLSANELRQIVFLEVKTGASANLSPRERWIRDAVLERRVHWQELRLEGPKPDDLPASLFLSLRSESGETVGQLEVLPAAEEIRYWSDWSEPPIGSRLAPEILVRIGERRFGLRLATEEGNPCLHLDDDLRIEVDRDLGRLRLRFGDEASVDYLLDAERVTLSKGALVLELDGKR